MENAQNINVRKKILTTAMAIISAIAINSAQAQTTLGSSHDYMNPCRKTIFTRYNILEPAMGDYSKDIDSRVIKNFHKEFADIQGERWYKSSNDGYIADFNVGSVKTVVAFNRKGQLHHTVSSYNEKGLPKEVWNEVKSVYYAYNILRIEEINFETHKIYLVHVEDDTYHKIIGVTEDNMMEIESLKKV